MKKFIMSLSDIEGVLGDTDSVFNDIQDVLSDIGSVFNDIN